MEHEAGEREDMQSGQYLGQTPIVTGEAPKAHNPGAVALDYPAAGQAHAVAFGLGQLAAGRISRWYSARSSIKRKACPTPYLDSKLPPLARDSSPYPHQKLAAMMAYSPIS